MAAVLLDGRGRCIGWGSNRRSNEGDPLGHAELVALGQAARLRHDWRFNDCTLVVNLEPCPMCAGAVVQARVGRVVFGAADPKRGALGSCLNLASHSSAHHRLEVVGGMLAMSVLNSRVGVSAQKLRAISEAKDSQAAMIAAVTKSRA